MAGFVTSHEPNRVGRFLVNGKGPTEDWPPYKGSRELLLARRWPWTGAGGCTSNTVV